MTQEGRDMGIYVYIKPIQFVIQQEQNTVKQQYSNKDIREKIAKVTPLGGKEKAATRNKKITNGKAL